MYFNINCGLALPGWPGSLRSAERAGVGAVYIANMAAEHDGAVHVNFSEEGCSTASLQEIQNYISQRVPFQDYHVSHDDLLGSCRTLLARVFPHWDVHRDVDFVQCKDGITNKRTAPLVTATHPS